jgi:hypothetical protein
MLDRDDLACALDLMRRQKRRAEEIGDDVVSDELSSAISYLNRALDIMDAREERDA